MADATHNIGLALLQAFGIPSEYVVKVELICQAGELPLLRVERAVLPKQPMVFAAELVTERYRVEPVPGDAIANSRRISFGEPSCRPEGCSARG